VASVTNIGNAVARTSTACIYINGVHQAGSDQGTRRLGPNGESDMLDFGQFECPCSDDLVNVTVCADNYNVVAESNEDNNCETNFVDNRVGDIEVTKEVRLVPLVGPPGPWEDEIDTTLGDNVEFRCSVHNSGCCCDLDDIRVIDVLSDSLEYVNAVPAPDRIGTNGATTLRWFETGPLEPCNWLNYTINATVIGCGVDTNTQTAIAITCTGVEVSDSAIATVNVPGEASIDATKEVQDPVTDAWVNQIVANTLDLVVFKSAVHNDGNVDLTNVVVQDTLGPNFGFINVEPGTPQPTTIVGNVLTWTVPGTLEPDETIEYCIRVRANGFDTVQEMNTQRATGYSADTNENVDDNDNAFVTTYQADINLAKGGAVVGISGTPIAFTIDVDNNPPVAVPPLPPTVQPLNTIRLVDTLPDGITYQGVPAADPQPDTVTYNADGTWTITWNNILVPPAVLGPGAAFPTINVNAYIDDDTLTGIYTNTVTVTGTPVLGQDVTETATRDVWVAF
jgi:uncharacterized repeat protein (TIGR01451 family)